MPAMSPTSNERNTPNKALQPTPSWALRVDVDFDQCILNCCAASLARAVAERCLVRCELLQFVITEDKLDIFRRYAGDVDGWVFARDAKEHEVMADSDWVEIEELRQRLWLEQPSARFRGFHRRDAKAY